MDKIWRQATCTSYHGPIRDRELIQKKRARFSSKPSTMVQWFDFPLENADASALGYLIHFVRAAHKMVEAAGIEIRI